MNLLEKIDEIRAKSVTPEKFEKMWGISLEDYLDNRVFADAVSTTLMADPADIAGFSVFLSRYQKALPMEKTAAEVL